MQWGLFIWPLEQHTVGLLGEFPTLRCQQITHGQAWGTDLFWPYHSTGESRLPPVSFSATSCLL